MVKLSREVKASKRMHRGQRWLPTEKYVPKVLACVECELPSYRGLPPFISVERIVDGERVKMYRHQTCPNNPKDILKLIQNDVARRLQQFKDIVALDFTSHRNRAYRAPRG